MDGTAWIHGAACRGTHAEELFGEAADQRKATALCTGCPVRTRCLAYALDHRLEFGVWGGMTERERRALLRRRPDVVSWRAILDAAARQEATAQGR